MENPVAICGLECDQCHIYLTDEDESIAEGILKWFKKEGWRPETLTIQDFMQEGKLIEDAVTTAIHLDKTTRDLGGTLGTKEVGDFICEEIRKNI